MFALRGEYPVIEAINLTQENPLSNDVIFCNQCIFNEATFDFTWLLVELF